MLVRSNLNRRYHGAHILHTKSRLGTDPIRSEEVVDARPQELAVDEELEWRGSFSLEDAVHEGGELVALEVFADNTLASCLQG